MTEQRLAEIRRKAAEVRKSKGIFVMLHVDDVEALAAAVWPSRPGIKWRASVQALSEPMP
jgi:hypothetical protein